MNCHAVQEPLDELDFIRVYYMTHPRIDPFGHFRAHTPQHAGSLLHAFQWNMRIDVAAPEKNRGSPQAALHFLVIVPRTD